MTNPTQYKSIYPPLTPDTYKLSYDRATPDENGNFEVLNYYENHYDYIEKFRVFIPPGAWRAGFEVLEWNGVSGVERYKKPPTTSGVMPDIYTGYILDSLEKNDTIFAGLPAGQSNGRTTLLMSLSEMVTEETCGWFYVKCNGDPGGPCYYNSLYMSVKADVYNAWYDKINWEKDVEGVEVYNSTNSVPSGNPTKYISLVGQNRSIDYGKAILNGSDKRISLVNNFTDGYIQYCRVFIPPGTVMFDFHILEWGGQKVVTRYKKPPIKNIEDFTEGGIGWHTNGSTLENLSLNDEIHIELEGRIEVASDNLTNENCITEQNCGWLYMCVGGGTGSTLYSNNVYLYVDPDVYNAWYDTIDWYRDVESVEVYKSKILENSVLSVNPSVLSFGNINLNYSSTLEFKLKNISQTALEITNITLPDGFSLVN